MAAKTVTVTVAMRDKLTAPSKKAARSVDHLSKTALVAGRRFKAAGLQYDEYIGKLKGGNVVIKDNTRAMRESGRTSTRVSRRIDRQATSHDRLTNKVSKSKTAMQKFRAANTISGVSRGLGQFSRQAIGAFKEPVAQALEYGKGIAEASTLTDEATFSTSKMREITLGMAKDFGGKTKDQTKALYDTISAGFGDAATAAKVMTSANRLAVGGVTDVATSTVGLTSTLNAYHQGAGQAAEFTDIFFATVKGGITTVPQLAANIGKVTPLASAMGVEFAEVGGILAALTAGGINTAESVTGIRSTLSAIKKPTKGAEREVRRLGLKLKDFSQQGVQAAGGLGPFLKMISKRDKFNSDSYTKLFGNIRALSTVTALSSENFSTLDRTMAIMNDRAGATDAAFSKIAKTDFQKLKKAEAQFQALKIELGEGLTPALVEAAAWINKEIIPGTSKWLKENKDLLRTLLPVAVAVVGIATVLAPVLLTISTGITVVTSLGAAFTTIIPIVGIVAGKFGALVGTLAGPLGAVALVGGLAFGLGTLIDKTFGISDKTADWLANLTGVTERLAWLDRRNAKLKSGPLTRDKQLATARADQQAATRNRKEVEREASTGVLSGLPFLSAIVHSSELDEAKRAEQRAFSNVHLLERKMKERAEFSVDDFSLRLGPELPGAGEGRKDKRLVPLQGPFLPGQFENALAMDENLAPGELVRRDLEDRAEDRAERAGAKSTVDINVHDDRIAISTPGGTVHEVPIGAGFAAEGI